MTINKQPVYHRATILFVATRVITPQELQAALVNRLQFRDLLSGTVECKEIDVEPGDPHDFL